ncbi:stress response protein nst1-like [Lotus japonicus]|uniref:stress response protein nst1-like n=1 Tax=Lotus japonicus TaxID=34305 RepID=UPI002590FE54|nr:stress response protein nst1-like [Lotus japonicus]
MMLLYNKEREARIIAARQRFEARTRRRQALHERRLREKLYTKIEEARKKKEEAENAARLEAALRESARLDALEQAAKLEAEVGALKAQVLAPVQVTNIASSSAQAPHSEQAAPSAPVQSDSRLDLIERRLDSQEALLQSLQEMCAEILKRTTKP